MRDPDLVLRAEQAAQALEGAWHRWRTMHGLEAGPLPPVSGYVGYSLEEPWGQPRVVFGVDAEEAEQLAAMLDGHDCFGPIHARVTSRSGGRNPAQQPPADPPAPDQPARQHGPYHPGQRPAPDPEGKIARIQVPAQAPASDAEGPAGGDASRSAEPAPAPRRPNPLDPEVPLDALDRMSRSDAGARPRSAGPEASIFADPAALRDAPVFRAAAAAARKAAEERAARERAAGRPPAEDDTGRGRPAGGGAPAAGATESGVLSLGAGETLPVQPALAADAAEAVRAVDARVGRGAAGAGGRGERGDAAAPDPAAKHAPDATGVVDWAAAAAADPRAGTPPYPAPSAPELAELPEYHAPGSGSWPEAPGYPAAEPIRTANAFQLAPPAAPAEAGPPRSQPDQAGDRDEDTEQTAVVAFRPRPELAAYLDEGPEPDPFLAPDDDDPAAGNARHRRVRDWPRSRQLRSQSAGDAANRASAPPAGPPAPPPTGLPQLPDRGPETADRRGPSSMAADINSWTSGELPGQAAPKGTAV